MSEWLPVDIIPEHKWEAHYSGTPNRGVQLSVRLNDSGQNVCCEMCLHSCDPENDGPSESIRLQGRGRWGWNELHARGNGEVQIRG